MQDIDWNKVSPELKAKLTAIDAKKPAKMQLQALQDLTDISQELLGVVDNIQHQTNATMDGVGALLTDIRESLQELKSKEVPEQPDVSTPIVESLSKLESTLTAAIKKIDVKPNVEAPDVNINAPPVNVDLKGVEKLLKNDIPKSFKEAIKLVPKTDIPKADYSSIIDELKKMQEQLTDVETAARLKPQPGVMKVTNPDGSTIAGSSAVGLLPFEFDDIQFSNADANGNYQTAVVENNGSTVATLTLSYDVDSKLTGVTRT